MSAFQGLRERVEAIVVGGSAGGVDALSVLLPALPADLRAPCFVALHLPRERPSLLVEIFAPLCVLPVLEADDKQAAEPGNVYFAPPDYHLLIEAGSQLALSVDPPVHFSRPSIDVLFESAADVYGERLLGIILSGANEDGAEGLAAVHRAGGITVVQHPGNALVSRMSEAALLGSPIDFVLTLQEIAALLLSLGNAGGASAEPPRGGI